MEELKGWNYQQLTMKELGIPFKIGQVLKVLTRDEAILMNQRGGFPVSQTSTPEVDFGWCGDFEGMGGKEIVVTSDNYRHKGKLSLLSSSFGTDMFYILEDVEE